MRHAVTDSASPGSRAAALDRTNWSAVASLTGGAVDSGLLSGAVAMAWRGGSLAHSSVVGWRDVAHRTPMEADSIFRLFSMTKPITAVAMMILWDEGKWLPSDPLAKHLPELANLKMLSASATEDGDTLVESLTTPTIEHLMTHQVGFSYGFTEEAVDCAFRAAGVPVIPHDITADDYLSRLATVPLAFEPGTGWRYSVSMDVQGIIIERLSGMSLRDFMVDRIFKPLDMPDTDFFVPQAKRERMATLYTLGDEGLIEMTALGELAYDNVAALAASDLVLPYDRPPVLASGGGGLVSTASDYLRFGRMLLGRGELEGRRVLSPEAVAHMTRSHTPAHLLTGAFGTAPHTLRTGYEYAYNGVAVTDPEAAGVRLGRDTYLWDGAAGCWFWIDPTNDLVFVCMVQLLTDAERLSLQFKSRSVVADILAGSVD